MKAQIRIGPITSAGVGLILLMTLSLGGCVPLDAVAPAPAQPTETTPATSSEGEEMAATAQPESASDEEVGAEVIIEASTQATFDDTLRIGAGNIWDEDYTDASGQPQHGLTAGLWLFVRDRAELNRRERVYPGQILEVAGYKIVVTEVGEDAVVLAITPPVE
jgi:hypothetical protein